MDDGRIQQHHHQHHQHQPHLPTTIMTPTTASSTTTRRTTPPATHHGVSRVLGLPPRHCCGHPPALSQGVVLYPLHHRYRRPRRRHLLLAPALSSRCAPPRPRRRPRPRPDGPARTRDNVGGRGCDGGNCGGGGGSRRLLL